MTEENEVRRFGKSLRHASRGFKYVLSNERNFQIEIAISFIVLMMVWIFKVKNWEAIILILIIMFVLIFELINTVVERVVDILKPRVHPYAKLVKDLMAAAVLISSIMAVVIGLIIFLPYVRNLID